LDLPTGETTSTSVNVPAGGSVTLRVYHSEGGYSVGVE
jgi:hypothetical protein